MYPFVSYCATDLKTNCISRSLVLIGALRVKMVQLTQTDTKDVPLSLLAQKMVLPKPTCYIFQ